jgi:CheY-like chemotaxis protein
MVRILVVDDERLILLTLSAILRMNGYEVETASSAAEAVEKLESSTFDAVLTDMNMETESAGYDVVRAVARTGRNTVVAILTGYAFRCADWQERGADDLLEKPIRPDVLLDRLAALLLRMVPVALSA